MVELDIGNGSDGDVTFSANKNLNTDIVAGGRSYADMVVYSCSTVNSDFGSKADGAFLFGQKDEDTWVFGVE